VDEAIGTALGSAMSAAGTEVELLAVLRKGLNHLVNKRLSPESKAISDRYLNIKWLFCPLAQRLRDSQIHSEKHVFRA